MTSNSAGVSTAFVDLATFDEMAAFIYGGRKAVTYFVLAVKKSNWFSHLPALLRHSSGIANFDSDVSASVNRSGDYVLNIWFQALIPQITMTNIGGAAGNININAAIRFCRNFMHNLVERALLNFNDLNVVDLDSAWFDVYKMYQVPESKQAAYNNMIALPILLVMASCCRFESSCRSYPDTKLLQSCSWRWWLSCNCISVLVFHEFWCCSYGCWITI